MIQNYSQWNINENNSQILEIGEMKGLEELKKNINTIFSSEVDKLSYMLKEVHKLVDTQGVDFIYWSNSPIFLSSEGTSLNFSVHIDIRYKNTAREDFEEKFSKFDPNDWKGVYIAESYEESLEKVTQILEEVKKKFSLEYKIMKAGVKPNRKDALLPENRVDILLSKENLLGKFLSAYNEENKVKLTGKKYGLL